MIDQAAALEHFDKVDPIMARCVREQSKHHNPPRYPAASWPRDYWRDLCKIVVYQQISIKAAEAIWRRVEPILASPVALSADTLREQGLSRQKANYLLAIISANIDFAALEQATDEQVLRELTSIKGIGPWSVEMFLIFSLARSDVFSIEDLGLRLAVSQLYDVEPDNHAAIARRAEQWSPHRTVASLSLWHILDNQPILL